MNFFLPYNKWVGGFESTFSLWTTPQNHKMIYVHVYAKEFKVDLFKSPQGIVQLVRPWVCSLEDTDLNPHLPYLIHGSCKQIVQTCIECETHTHISDFFFFLVKLEKSTTKQLEIKANFLAHDH